MDGLFTLLSLSLVMAVGSFVVGSLPLTFSLSPSQLRLISAIGMGVLVGTSLIVIIPEGVDTLYSSKSVQHQHKRDFTGRALDVRWEGPYIHPLLLRDDADGSELAGPTLVKRGGEGKTPPKAPTEEGVVGILGSDTSSKGSQEKQDSQKPTETQEEGHKESSPHTWVGIALVSGFIMMYLIDKLPQFASSSSKQQQRYHISLDNLGSGIGRGSSSSRDGGLLETPNSPRPRSGFATTTGLVIHAAADGIALGASSSNTNLSFIIFFAIMVHKAPASFGLTSVLLKQGLSSRAIRGHLLIFSLAAPVGALATWFIAHTLRASHAGDEAAVRWRTGILLLFSAGTFLYVAMHTMQENGLDSVRHEGHANGYTDAREPAQRSKKSMRDLIASVVGMILPLFLQIGHAH
ncbi:hypothetical protein FQN54_005204 [Arachnomyces sp. PD_36]|nr:hypothetical protein FQN54_005204 [Arachnomyces sp. PD_36]